MIDPFNSISYYQRLSNDEKFFVEFIEPIKMYRGNFSTINSDGMKQTNYHSNAELTGMFRLSYFELGS